MKEIYIESLAGLQIIKSIRVEIGDDEDGFFHAVAPDLDEFGMGATPDEAVSDLKAVLVELYLELESFAAKDRLGDDLSCLFNRLSDYIRK